MDADDRRRCRRRGHTNAAPWRLTGLRQEVLLDKLVACWVAGALTGQADADGCSVGAVGCASWPLSDGTEVRYRRQRARQPSCGVLGGRQKVDWRLSRCFEGQAAARWVSEWVGRCHWVGGSCPRGPACLPCFSEKRALSLARSLPPQHHRARAA